MSDDHGKSIAKVEVDTHTGNGMSPVVERILDLNPDTATLREVLQLQREYERDEAKRAYTCSLVELKRDLPTVIGHDKRVDFGAGRGRTVYTHTSLAAAMEAVTGALTKHGFSLSWKPSTEKNIVTVRCELTHRVGHSEQVEVSAPADTSGSKGPAQAVASTITYLQRYTALALLGIATADMTEPHGERSENERETDAIDTRQNLKAAAAIRDRLGDVTAAEELVSKPVAKWTSSDLDTLRSWLMEQMKPSPKEVIEPDIDETIESIQEDLNLAGIDLEEDDFELL